ncbi:melanization protease 1-like [Culex pipiens pallens]|uniref:melanization protease 1-like n=1 Tax=Culex pipiens pallens TaxID=42434 RepID=UPI00195316EC|nr:melanization protease 1-like [Culex pipiens pallens]
MANLLKKLVITCVLLGHQIISSQESVPCLTDEAKPGSCVDIDHCPFLRELAQATILSTQERALLNRRVCGPRKVCCEEPSGVTLNLPTSSTPASEIRVPIVAARTAISKKMTLPDTTVCGPDNLGDRIFGGNKTEIDQFPWTVALEYRNKNPPSVDCGGSLINTRYVITAAHCVQHVRKEDLIARLGEYDLESDLDCDGPDNCNLEVIYAKIAEIKIHFKFRYKQNDIALLKLQNALPEDYYDYFLPICLPQSAELEENLFIDRNVTVVGWGSTGNETRSRFKMQTDLVTTSVEECQNDFQLALVAQKVHPNHICAKSATELKQGTCGGDSGGPLMTSVNGNWYLIGVVSLGPPCGKSTLPGVYTRVTSHMSWIKENLVN